MRKKSTEGLVERLRQGDRSVIGELYDENKYLARHLARKFARESRAERGEIIAYACFNMYLAIHECCEQNKLVDNNLSPYITARLVNRLKFFLQRERRRAKSLKRFAGSLRKGVILKSKKNDDDEEETNEVGFDVPTLEREGIEGVDVLDIIEKLIRNDRDRQILELRVEGLTDEEIGGRLGVSKQRITKIRDEMKTRLQRLMGE